MVAVEQLLAALGAGGDHRRKIEQRAAPAEQGGEMQQFEQGHAGLHPA